MSYFLVIEDERPVVYAHAISRMDLDSICFIDENGMNAMTYSAGIIWRYMGNIAVKARMSVPMMSLRAFRNVNDIGMTILNSTALTSSILPIFSVVIGLLIEGLVVGIHSATLSSMKNQRLFFHDYFGGILLFRSIIILIRNQIIADFIFFRIDFHF